jgi:hypothetical protein
MDNYGDQHDVTSYDDLQVTTAAGTTTLECPVCGVIATPRREPTLSDFTNAALTHLEELHPESALRAA